MPTASETILAGLNDRQREAVLTTEGPVLVIAGPGSGKTRALTHRIAYLIAAGRHPAGILAVTFTNRAAGEMRERVRELVDGNGAGGRRGGTDAMPWIGTFHAFAAHLLRQEAARVGFKPNFTIYDESDSAALLREVMKEEAINTERYPPPMIAGAISRLKGDLVAPAEYEGRDSGEPFERTLAKMYDAYQQRLRFANAMDFDDLVFHTVRLLRSDAAARQRWQRRFQYVHIDEYQDTSPSQYELIRLLAAEHRNVFAIGDDAQSIYSWRQADFRNILNFERDWPEATVVLLEENYRSTPEILTAANHLIKENVEQRPKTLWTNNPSGSVPLVHAEAHERAEAAFVGDEILSSRAEGRHWSDVAVLYRTNAQSRALEEALLERDIPYVIIGGVRFFERREVKDLAAWLRFLSNPDDSIALKRIINVPARGIGPKTLLAYLSGDAASLGERERARITAFERTVAKLRDALASQTLAEFLRFLIKETNYEAYLEEVSRDAEARIENVREFVTLARRYDALPITEAVTKLTEEIALASEQDELRTGEERVRLMTVHAAKGLEFPVVFLTGLEEGILPHARSLTGGRAELEEERRLAYVGMTRAKERLYLTWAVERMLFGERQANLPSRFLRELPPEVTARAVLRDEELEEIYLDE
ncbi:ATP-dependent DNA helicase PcrA [Candidatus Parcubacteria bacterium]|nr:MAG: ATP-dependent DNA helicase PcrA [Candidatus Parcubacteria bacterium]